MFGGRVVPIPLLSSFGADLVLINSIVSTLPPPPHPSPRRAKEVDDKKGAPHNVDEAVMLYFGGSSPDCSL
jgi:hypothetical protein